MRTLPKVPGGRLIVMIVAATGGMALSAQAINLVVSSISDSGPGSLRQAISDNHTLGGDNTIVFTNAVTGTIHLTTGELLIRSNLTILGPGPLNLAIDGNRTGRVFHITNGAAVRISGLTVTNGAVSGAFPGSVGGGIWNDHSSLTLSNCTITGNSGGNGPAGGIYNDRATLNLRNCTISSNSAPVNNGGGIWNYGFQGGAQISITDCAFADNVTGGSETVGGAIFNDGNFGRATLFIYNSTFSSNSATFVGGAIHSTAASGTELSVVTVRSCTFAGNSAPVSGAAIFNTGASAVMTLGSSLFRSGTAGANVFRNGGTFTSEGFNLSDDTGSGLLNKPTDQVNTNPLLEPLQNNGGPTLTHALLPGSPAIDKGHSFGVATDQRGAQRSFDFLSVNNAALGDGSDIGAFEVGRPLLGIEQAGGNIVVYWRSYFGPLALESSTNINSPTTWNAVIGSASLEGSHYRQTNSPSPDVLFFRLRQE